MQMNLIGLSGQQGVGKTSVSLLLLKYFPRYHRASFGDFVRQEIGAEFQVRMETLYRNLDDVIELNEERERAGMLESMTASRLVKWYEHEVVRPKNPNHWVMLMEKWLQLCEEKNIPGMVIDDIGFSNEANLIKRWRGLLVNLEPYPGYEPPAEASQRQSAEELAAYRGFHCVFSPQYGEGHLEDVAQAIARRFTQPAL